MPRFLSNNMAEKQHFNIQSINIQFQKQIDSNSSIRNSKVYLQI